MRIGGPADFFARPRSVEEVVALVQYAKGRGLSWTVLGNGTNVLFPDAGFRGLVIHLGRGFSRIEIDEGGLRAQSGAGLGEAMGRLRAKGFHDLDGLVGIPGTIGGALAMNAGTPESTVSDMLIRATILAEEGEIRVLAPEECGFGYRSSLFQRRPWVILEAEFRIDGEPRFEMQALMERRRNAQPLRYFSAGCVFRNPGGPLTAGQLLDRAGLKGFRCGDAMISPIHANFIVNQGRASASDVVRLLDIARRRVYKLFGVELRPELVVASHSR